VTFAPVDRAHMLQALKRIPEVLHCGRILFD
jgi:hypothetical protein